MKYIDEYRDEVLIRKLAVRIRESAVQDLAFMEVCGGHTSAIHRFGIPSLLPGNISLISGPGCPVCVTGRDFIDKAVVLCRMENTILTTFGDLIRVPGSFSSLEKEKSEGADIRIVFSALEALDIARKNPGKNIVFLAIGFETTAPGTAVTVQQANMDKFNNFYILSAHKVMPPAMEAILNEGVKINGFICPGHVAAVTGSSIFDFIPDRYNLGCVITGFEPIDILQSIMMLVQQINNKTPQVEIQYNRAVTRSGNLIALEYLKRIFEPCDAYWRGIGIIKGSGLKLRKEFDRFDAGKLITSDIRSIEDDGSCICGEILRGMKRPDDCPLFPLVCTPDNPVGACMVSNEGACNTWYKYRKDE